VSDEIGETSKDDHHEIGAQNAMNARAIEQLSASISSSKGDLHNFAGAISSYSFDCTCSTQKESHTHGVCMICWILNLKTAIPLLLGKRALISLSLNLRQT
jgi:hypothetical protein